MKRLTTGYNAIIKSNIDAVFASYLVRFRVNHQIAIPAFIGYSLQTNGWEGHVNSVIGGSAQPGANAQQFADYQFLLPPLAEQRAIVSILSSLDDKIDLLHRQNKTLEALAETLFRQWFIIGSNEQWPITSIGNIVTIKGGTTPSTTNLEFWDGSIYWSTPKDLSDSKTFLTDTDRKITEKGLAQIGSGLMPVGTVLLSSRAPIGYLTITDVPTAINQGYIAVICDKEISNFYMYLWIKNNLDVIINAANGSTFLEISKSTFKGLEFKIPPADMLLRFHTFAESTFEKIRANIYQIRTLTSLRDTLLPKLMSGEVRVGDAGQVVESAVAQAVEQPELPFS